jgi:hypothetical protein
MSLPQAQKALNIAKNRQTRTAPSVSGGDPDVAELESKLEQLQDSAEIVKRLLGEGRMGTGEVLYSQGPRGIASRCALSMLQARHKDVDPRLASASAVPNFSCAHEGTVPCRFFLNLAQCYYCGQPLCPAHRCLIASSKEREGHRLGGATCCCVNKDVCLARVRKQEAVLSEGMDAMGSRKRREQADSASRAKSKGRGRQSGSRQDWGTQGWQGSQGRQGWQGHR